LEEEEGIEVGEECKRSLWEIVRSERK